MAKKAYIGVGGVARKIKKGYIGVGKYDANTLLMLHGDLSDESVYARSVTNSGVTVSKDKSKFGGSSLYFNGSASYFTVPNLISGNTPFTVDFWAYPTAAKTNIMWSHGGSNGDWGTGGVFSFDADTTLNYYRSGYHIDGTTACPINQWHHIAVVGNGSSIKLYANGVCVGTYSSTYNFVNVDEMFGANQSATSECFTGYIDEIRVSNVARWTSNFTPPTGAYVPTDGSSGGIARKIKKAYVGIGGVARPCWSGGELAYFGKITPFSQVRQKHAAATTGARAIFAAGAVGLSTYIMKTDVYDTSLTLVGQGSTGKAARNLAAASLGDCAIFGCGETKDSVLSHTVRYSASLETTTSYSLTARHSLAATTIGDHAVFAGGSTSTSSLGSPSAVVEALDVSLTKTTASNLSANAYELAATTVGDYALFGGGLAALNSKAEVTAYTSSFTKSVPAALSYSRCGLAAATAGNYALFCGGNYKPDYSAGTPTSYADYYDASLTKGMATSLSAARTYLAATSIGEYAIFAGGYGSDVVDVYDASLTRTTQTPLHGGVGALAAVTFGNYALFGGGATANNTGECADVTAYVIA